MSDKISEYVSKKIGVLNEDSILEFGKKPNALRIFNVIRGLEKEAFSIHYRNKNDYDFIYISKRNKLIGYFLNSGISMKYSTNCTAAFCQMLHEKFEELDEIAVFNTFQNLLRTVLEKDGIFTLSNHEYETLKGKELALKVENGIAIIPFINKIELYRSIFKGRVFKDDTNQNKLYLMLNQNTNKIKIGYSKKIAYREGTLQSKEPAVKLICSWIAPREIETLLHKKYDNKRVRGEWFNLNPRELKEINDVMKEYKKTQC
jgi:Meiotically Up-regulated Gene 113 (MUG113) protein